MVGAERERLDISGAIAKREHLLPGQSHLHGAPQRPGREHRKRQFTLRAQARAEAAADIRRQDPYGLLRDTKHVGDVVPAIHGSLGLVVDGDAVVAFPNRGGAEHLHRIVMLDRHAVFDLNPDRRSISRVSGFQSAIDSIHCYPFLTVIEKRRTPVSELVAPKRGSEWAPFLR